MHQSPKRRNKATILITCVVLLVGVGLCGKGGGGAPMAGARSRVDPPPRWKPSAPSKDVVRLLGGLDIGSAIKGYRVAYVGVSDRQIEVAFERDRSGFSVYVARRGAQEHLAPYNTDRYDVFVGGARDYGGPVPPEVPPAVADVVRERIARTEKDVAVPAGL